MNKKRLNYKGSLVRWKKDASIEERAPLSFVLGLRWQLGEWGFSKAAIKVDQEWREWAELRESPKLQFLSENANKKVATSG